MTARATLLAVLAASLLHAPARAEDARDEAERRFRRGAELYKEGDLTSALVELKRAYELVGSYKILYNLGQVSYERHDYAGALRYYRDYLREGADSVRPERRRELGDEIARLEQRVGKLEILDVEPGLEIFVDDATVGTAPLPAPIAVNEGRRKVEVVGRTGERRSRLVDVPGGALVRASFAPVPEARLEPRPPPAPPPKVLIASPAREPATTPAAGSGAPWVSWIATALLGAGAATTGVLAWNRERELQRQLDSFPADGDGVASTRREARNLSLLTDGLLAGTLVMTAVSIYLTARRPSDPH